MGQGSGCVLGGFVRSVVWGRGRSVFYRPFALWATSRALRETVNFLIPVKLIPGFKIRKLFRSIWQNVFKRFLLANQYWLHYEAGLFL